jgi:outer membrane protein assembly factor BamB
VGATAAGRELVFVGNQLGTLIAYDAASGQRVWSFQAGGAIAAGPVVANGTVYVGSFDKKLYALDAATGALSCSVTTTGLVLTPPIVVDPDGAGPIVYFGRYTRSTRTPRSTVRRAGPMGRSANPPATNRSRACGLRRRTRPT